MKNRILIIDDENQIRNFMRICINAEGYEYFEAHDGKSGLDQIKEIQPNLIILDLGLPDIDGYHILRSIRQTSKIPVLILTARDEEDEKVKLLNGGANDYLSKPFSVKELIARIKVLLRDISYSPQHEVLNFEGFSVNTQSMQVTTNNTHVSLSKKEYALLIRLVEKPDTLITYKELLIDIWGESHVHDSHYLRILVAQLRKKISDDADMPKFIKTEAGIGYRFIGKIEIPK